MYVLGIVTRFDHSFKTMFDVIKLIQIKARKKLFHEVSKLSDYSLLLFEFFSLKLITNFVLVFNHG